MVKGVEEDLGTAKDCIKVKRFKASDKDLKPCRFKRLVNLIKFTIF
jgi:hypothetical protein